MRRCPAFSRLASLADGVDWMAVQRAMVDPPQVYWEPAPYLLTVATAAILAGFDWNRRFAPVELALLCGAPLLFYLYRSDALHIPLHTLTVGSMLLVARAPRRLLAWLGGTGAAVLLPLGWWVGQAPWRVARVQAWLMPYKDPNGGGYLLLESRRLLQEAGWLGHGPGAGLQLPGLQGELVFPFIVHSLGWVAGLALLALSGCLLYRLWSVARQVREPFGRVLAAGLLTVLAVQFLWNLGMVFGLAPLVSLPLPFVTFGRSVTVQVAAAGLLLGVYRRKDLISECAAR